MVNTLYEVLEYGPIVAFNEDYRCFITYNPVYFNYWVEGGDGFRNIDCTAVRDTVKQGRFGDIVDEAESLLVEFIRSLE